MKAKLEFNIPEEQQDFDDALNGWSYKSKLEEVWNKVFRPSRKYGYNNPILDSEYADYVIEELIKIYNEVTDDQD